LTLREKALNSSIILYLTLLAAYYVNPAYGAAFSYRFPDNSKGVDPKAVTVVGTLQYYSPTKEDTLLDIARKFGLGFHEVTALHREMDPWLPPEGLKIPLPTHWVLPETRRMGIVVNIPEMRLYLFLPSIRIVTSFPIALGDPEWVTPVGLFTVVRKRVNPTWHIPKSLQEEYGMSSMPPGPDNPLGSHCLELSPGDYRIHGTHQPWGVGRLVSHGCIRLYPEDITELYKLVPVGTPVEIVYEPVKIGFKGGRVFVEVHSDKYDKVPDLLQYATKKISQRGLSSAVNLEKLILAVKEKSGIPVDVTED
jgi:L,D-transpeptidase ErfK/SrfK